MQEHLQAIATVLSLINPLMCGAIFVQAEGSRPLAAKMADASRATMAVLVILVLAALFGTQILHLFGVSLDAFSVAGGGVLSWIGFSMLKGNSTGGPDPNKADPNKGSSLTPLILFAASPGTITGVITVAARHVRQDDLPVTALVAVAVGVVVMWAVIVLVARRANHPGGTSFLRDTVTRFMGLIVIAMGVQFALSGFRGFMKGSG